MGKIFVLITDNLKLIFLFDRYDQFPPVRNLSAAGVKQPSGGRRAFSTTEGQTGGWKTY